MRNPAKLSMPPMASAAPELNPCFWKKRTFIAIRAALVGTARPT